MAQKLFDYYNFLLKHVRFCVQKTKRDKIFLFKHRKSMDSMLLWNITVCKQHSNLVKNTCYIKFSNYDMINFLLGRWWIYSSSNILLIRLFWLFLRAWQILHLDFCRKIIFFLNKLILKKLLYFRIVSFHLESTFLNQDQLWLRICT